LFFFSSSPPSPPLLSPLSLHDALPIFLCAGAFNTPKLLMLSGVGDADSLRKHGIDVVADVREVGRHLQNHPGVDVQYTTNSEDSDRKSTRLNSSHQIISYAVFCLKKKK